MAFGRLERTRAAPPMSDINITPLVDVMLVLVVIFILAAPLLASSIRLELPRTDGAGAHAAPPQSVTVVVDKAGQAFINDEPLAQPALAQRFIALAAAQPGLNGYLSSTTGDRHEYSFGNTRPCPADGPRPQPRCLQCP